MILYSTTLLQLQAVVVITIVAMDQNCCLIFLLIVKLPQESLTVATGAVLIATVVTVQPLSML